MKNNTVDKSYQVSVYSDLVSISESLTNEWYNFVKNHQDGNFFQTPQYFKSCLKSSQIPYAIIAKRDGVIVGCLVSTLLKEGHGIKAFFSSRCIVIGGPLVTNNDKNITDLLLKCHDDIFSKKAIFTQIRNLYNLLPQCDIFRENGYYFESHLNFIIRLDSCEDMWERIGKGRLKQIKKAIKQNLHVDVYQDMEISEELLSMGYDVIKSVYIRANLPLVNERIFQMVRDERSLVLFVVRDQENNFLGCRFAIKFNDKLFGWYAGSYEGFYRLFPNDMLIWETIKWGCENGYKSFDYGGAGSPNKYYGVRNFKSQMGGELVNFGRYEKIYRKNLFQISKLGFQLMKKVTKLV